MAEITRELSDSIAATDSIEVSIIHSAKIGKPLQSYTTRKQCTVDSDHEVTCKCSTVLADLSSESITITLPPASSVPAGQQLTVKRIDSTGSRTLTLQCSGSDKLDDSSSKNSSASYAAYVIESNGASKWLIVGFYSP